MKEEIGSGQGNSIQQWRCHVRSLTSKCINYEDKIEKLQAEIKELKSKIPYRCAGSRGAQPTNECCGGCDGCIEMQWHYYIDTMSKEIKELKRQREKQTEVLAKIYHTECFGCNLSETMKTIESVLEIEEPKKR